VPHESSDAAQDVDEDPIATPQRVQLATTILAQQVRYQTPRTATMAVTDPEIMTWVTPPGRGAPSSRSGSR
jgi:hypothetical protein